MRCPAQAANEGLLEGPEPRRAVGAGRCCGFHPRTSPEGRCHLRRNVHLGRLLIGLEHPARRVNPQGQLLQAVRRLAHGAYWGIDVAERAVWPQEIREPPGAAHSP